MRLFLFVSVICALLAGASVAQQLEPPHTVDCTPDKTKADPGPRETERPCLQQLNGLATRSGNLLRITLENGTTKTFKDEREACERNDVEKCVLHRLTAYYPAQRLFVIEVDAYESFRVIAVHRRSGSVTQLDDYPHLAPGGKRFVTAFSSEAWDVERDIGIYSVAADSLELEWEYKAQDYEIWNFVAWDGDDGVKLTVISHVKDSSGKSQLATRRAPRCDEPRRVGD